MPTIEQQLRALGFDESQIAAATVDGRPLGEIEKAKAKGDGMNKTERHYSWELEELRKQGVVLQWEFEGITLKLAESGVKGQRGARYTPDFVVWFPMGRMQCVEIKGFMRESARVRFLLARRLYPNIEFVMIRKAKVGWETIL